VIAVRGASLKQMHIHACPFVFVRQQSENRTQTNIPVSQSCYLFLHGIMYYDAKLRCDSPNRHPSVFCDERINSLHSVVAVRGRPLRGRSTMSLLPSTPHAVGTHSGIFIHVTKSTKDFCSRIVLHYDEFHHCTLAK
jgi:hypothetical protein